MLQPGNTKHRKLHRPSIKEKTSRGLNLIFGIYGLKALEKGIISNKELMSGRMVIKRGLKKSGSSWLRIFPDISITGKKGGVRMGKGKGAVIGWVCPISKGQIVFEIAGVPKELALTVLEIVSSKLSVKTKIVILKK